MATTVLLADDHKILRDGLRMLLEKSPQFQVVAEAGEGRTAVQLAQERRPDIAIIDIGMPLLNGIEATRQIRATAPGVKVIALSMHAEKEYVVEMLQAGASGYLLKESAFEELTNALHFVLEGQVYLSPKVNASLIQDFIKQSTPVSQASTVFSVLTGREREVLQLLAEGKTSKEIAHVLDMSVKTVDAHRQRIMEKLQLHSVAELTKYAVREGLTSL